jgi:hypothetical protein
MLLDKQAISVTSTGGVKARFVKVMKTLTVPQDAMHVNELEVFDSAGTNIARGKPVTVDTLYDGSQFPAKFADDALHSTMWHSACSQPGCKAWMQVDLGVAVNILAIRVMNRQDRGTEFRSIGVFVQALDDSGAVVYESNPSSHAPAYLFYPIDKSVYAAAFTGYRSGNTYNTAYVRLNLPTSSQACPAECGKSGTRVADSICIPGFFRGPCPDAAALPCDGPACAPAPVVVAPVVVEAPVVVAVETPAAPAPWKKWYYIAGGCLLVVILLALVMAMFRKKKVDAEEPFADTWGASRPVPSFHTGL